MESTSTGAPDLGQPGNKNEGAVDPNLLIRSGGTAEDYATAFSNLIDEAVRRALALKINAIVSDEVLEHRAFLQTGIERVDELIDDVKQKAREESIKLWRRLEEYLGSHCEARILAARIDKLCDIVDHHAKQMDEGLGTVKVFHLKRRGESDSEQMLGSTMQDGQRD
jgi:hypothetical protein